MYHKWHEAQFCLSVIFWAIVETFDFLENYPAKPGFLGSIEVSG